jgi:hypothetical protein
MTAEVFGEGFQFADTAGYAACQLRDNAGNVIGEGHGSIAPQAGGGIDGGFFDGRTTLTFNGGTVNPPGGSVSLWCGGKNLSFKIFLESGQLLAMQVGGFF